MQIWVKSSKDNAPYNFSLDVEPTESIACVKEKILAKMGVAVDEQQLLFCGKEMTDEDKSLPDYGMCKTMSLDLVWPGSGIAEVEASGAAGNSKVMEQTAQDPAASISLDPLPSASPDRRICIVNLFGQCETLPVHSSDRISDVKLRYAYYKREGYEEKGMNAMPPQIMVLVFCGKELTDETLVEELDPEDGASWHLIIRP